MRVAVAHSGIVLDVGSTPLSSLKQVIAVKTDINTSDQILLFESGERLSNESQLEDIVFLFDSRHVRNPPPLPTKQSETKIASFPELPSPSPDHRVLANSPSVMLRSLPEYERTFRHHVEVARVHLEQSSNRIREAQKGLEQSKIMQRAMQACMRNLRYHCETFEEFWGAFSQAQKDAMPIESDLLNRFEADLSQLRKISLHPKLQTSQRVTLLDCVSEGGLRTLFKDCLSSHDQLIAKTKQLEDQFNSIQSDTSGAEKDMALPPEIEELVKGIEGSESVRKEQQMLLEILTQDHTNALNVVSTAVEESVARKPLSINPADICAAFEQQLNNHIQQVIPHLEDLAGSLQNVTEQGEQLQVILHEVFFKTLLRVSRLQQKIKITSDKVSLYAAAGDRKRALFKQLESVKELPRAYNMALEEIARRREWSRNVQFELNQITERLQTLRNDELPRRERFQQQWGVHLPRHFLSELAHLPSQMNLSYTNVDDHLPHIEREDILGGGASSCFRCFVCFAFTVVCLSVLCKLL